YMAPSLAQQNIGQFLISETTGNSRVSSTAGCRLRSSLPICNHRPYPSAIRVHPPVKMPKARHCAMTTGKCRLSKIHRSPRSSIAPSVELKDKGLI
ncbi:hypothetical protein, partial [Pseudomonas putida]